MTYFQDRPATPGEALSELLAGNLRFTSGTRVHPNQDAEHRAALAAEQRPFAVVFGCSDSRLAAEMIFDRGLGDLFVVRTAGHIIGAEVIASIEYGVSVLGTPLVVVLGHDSCGAIQAAYQADRDGGVADHLRPVVDRVAPQSGFGPHPRVADEDGIAGVHVQRTVELITRQGSAVRLAVDAGECAVVGMTYRLADSQVTMVTP